ncbi:ATP-binding cassette domain-containing protein, partial [Bacillus thuringiensis]|nr:ATP-binding cassette domain-containing protein [Bacillus thuringiensis]
MEIVRIENVVKSYGEGNSRVDALKGINLSIQQGEFVSIVGASGSGKSTL